MNDDRASQTLPNSQSVPLAQYIETQAGSVVSKTLIKRASGNVTLFAFDQGQGLSEHSAPFDALVLGVEGSAILTIGGKDVPLSAGEAVLMPANVPHAVRATSPFKMTLIMIRDAAKD
ncbi:MAG: cupin domain-containing protein [Myxococcota bacterium]|jgi:quercetin dioxygenase-like cupin family protein|nr:cupin domain-containing protein [Myxococcota bacterium]